MQIALIYADRLETESLYSVQKLRLEQIERCLRAHAWSVVRIPRSGIPVSLDSFDLVVVAGGDGTQLDAARRILYYSVFSSERVSGCPAGDDKNCLSSSRRVSAS